MEKLFFEKHAIMFPQFALGKIAILIYFIVLKKDLSIVHCQWPLASEELK